MTILQFEKKIEEMRIQFAKEYFSNIEEMADQDLLQIYAMILAKEKSINNQNNT